MEEKKITVEEFINNNELLELTYTPYTQKMEICSKIVTGVTNAVGGLNSALLYRTAEEVIIETITNIDLKGTDDDGLTGYDHLVYTGEMDNLIAMIGNEYKEFKKVLQFYINDYVRIETNPALTISKIYSNVVDFGNSLIEMFSNYIQGLSPETITEFIQNVGEVANSVTDGTANVATDDESGGDSE